MPDKIETSAARAADRFMREALRGIIGEEDITRALDKAIATATAEYLDTVDAAAFLACSVEQLEIWRHQHQGPPYCRLGKKRVRYKREDLRAWMDATRVVPQAAEA